MWRGAWLFDPEQPAFLPAGSIDGVYRVEEPLSRNQPRLIIPVHVEHEDEILAGEIARNRGEVAAAGGEERPSVEVCDVPEGRIVRFRHLRSKGGEIEINPDSPAHLYGTEAGQSWDEEWPALSALRHVKPERLEPQVLVEFWRGEREDAYGELAVIATIALGLRGLGRDREAAFAEARQRWSARDRSIG